MFTEREKTYMRQIGLSDLNFDDLSDDDWARLEDLVGDRLEIAGMDKEYKPTKEGSICEEILSKIPK